ncbi:MAG: YwiC-like family protein [Elusimicrobia bacterium]|nr:YwiC-like family protein [Elusimicrobiota bacterium]
MLPREHGSWALLLVPIALGAGAAGVRDGGAVALFTALALFGFLARVPLLALVDGTAPRAGRWLALYGGLAGAALALLLGLYGRWLILAFGVLALGAMAWTVRLTLARRQMSLANELVGVFGLSLGAPAAHYAATGSLGVEAWTLWALSALYLVGPVFHVKAAVAGHRAALNPAMAPALPAALRRAVAYHAAAIALVVAGAAAVAWPWAAAAPFCLAYAKTVRLAARSPAKADFRRLGWSEMSQAAFFTGWLILVL